MKKAVVVALVVAATLCAALAWGQGGGTDRRTGPGGFGARMMSCPAAALAPPQAMMLDRAAETLQLTDEQKGKLRDVTTKSEEAMRPILQKASEASLALRAAVLAPEYDAEKVKQLVTNAQRAEDQVINARLATWAQIRSVLTADQLAKLQEVMTMRRRGTGGPTPGSGTPPGGSGPGSGGSSESAPPPAPGQ